MKGRLARPEPHPQSKDTELKGLSRRRALMSKSAYVLEGGTRCPLCKGQVEPSLRFSQNEDGQVIQRVSCLECGESYDEIYVLKEYRI